MALARFCGEFPSSYSEVLDAIQQAELRLAGLRH